MQDQFYEQTEEEEIKLTDYLHIISRYKWLIIAIFVLVVAATVIYTYHSPKIYSASSTIMLEEKSSENLLFSSMANKATSINNYIEILKSRPVLEAAYSIIQNSEIYPEIPLNPANHEEPDKFSPIGAIKEKLAVESQRETDIIKISYESTHPGEAKLVANALALGLQNKDNEYARIEFKNVREFLENRLDETERRLRNSEEDLRSYKIDKGISMLSEETTQIIEQSAELELLLSEAETEYAVAKNRLDFLTSELSDQDKLLSDVNSIITTPLLEQLRREIVTNQSKYLNLLSKPSYSPDHPELVALKNQIDNAKRQLNEEIQKTTNVKAGTADPLVYRADLISSISKARVEKNIAESKVENLRKSVEQYNRQLSLLPDAEIELARLERNNRINEKTYTMLNEKFEEARIAEKSKMGKIRIVEEAQLPGAPIKPNKKMNLLIAIVLGLGGGIGSSFLLHSLDSKIRTFDDVRNYVSLPILGTIPFIRVHDSDIDYLEKQIKNATDKEKEELKQIKQQVESKLITNYAPKSSISESFRMLRTNIVAKKKKDQPLSLLVTSSGPKEGKSTIISNLAVALSQMDKKVILVDLDLRRPMQHKIFDLEKNEGISDFLYDHDKALETFIKKTKIDNLDIITSGFIPPNPSELIASSHMDEVLDILKQKYDYILLDTPPTMAVTDSIILAKKVDLRALAVRINQADKIVIKRIKEILDNVDSDFTGAIINGIHPQKYYSSYEYNYYYYYYYGKEDEKKDGALPKKSS